MDGRFVLRRSGAQFSFSLKAGGNNEVILASERYTVKASALQGIEAIRVNAARDSRYERRVSSAGQPYFVLRAANNEVLGTSEMYSSNTARDGGMVAVRSNAPTAVVDDQTHARA